MTRLDVLYALGMCELLRWGWVGNSCDSNAILIRLNIAWEQELIAYP